MSSEKRKSWIAIVLCSALVLACSGCFSGAMRLPTRTRDVSGQPQKLDFSFLKAGSTTKEEVTKNLGAIEMHMEQTDIFWGRWERSTWGHGIVVGAPPLAGGAEGKRVWGSHNLLIRFDEQGVVKNWIEVGDKDLYERLDFLALGRPLLDLSSPARAKVYMSLAAAEVILSADSFEYTAEATDECGKIKTPRANIAKVASGPSRDHSIGILVTIYFAEPVCTSRKAPGSDKTVSHKSLELRVEPSTLLLLRRYFKQTQLKSSL